MLKHASNTFCAMAANGQLRNNCNASSTPTLATTITTITTSSGSVGVGPETALQQHQQLNISTLSASTSLQPSLKSNESTTRNGGPLIPSACSNLEAPPHSSNTLLNIAAEPISSCHNMPQHTYTNQPLVVATINGNPSKNTTICNLAPALPPPLENNFNLNNQTSCLQFVKQPITNHGLKPREVLTSLGLLCFVSLLFALLSLMFLLKISPNNREDSSFIRSSNSEDFIIVYDVTLALCTLSLSLNLCCLLVCAIQFLFAVKLVISPMIDGCDNKYLEKSSASRKCAVGGFFISIPIFLTGIILFTFNNFHSTSAIVTSVLIGVGIIFCGFAMVHNVFIWQKEKTNSYRTPPLSIAAVANTTVPADTAMPAYIVPTPMQRRNPLYQTSHTPTTTETQYSSLHQQIYPCHNSISHFNLHPTSGTPISPNHSHGSFNPLINAAGPINTPIHNRPSSVTPPSLKFINGRETSGSVTPTLDISKITSQSLHELSTLV